MASMRPRVSGLPMCSVSLTTYLCISISCAFVHIDILRRCGLSGLVAVEGVALRAVAGERGLTAVAILSWEAAQVK